MKILIKAQWLACFALFCVVLSTAASAQAAEKDNKSLEETYTVWKNGGFLNFIVDKKVNFGQYKKIIVFPLKYDDLQISKKAKKRIARNWSDFAEDDMPAIAESFTKIAKREFSGSDSFALTETGGEGVLVAQFIMAEIMPHSYRDASLGTVGKESVEIVATLTYKVALVDSKTHALVAMIDDDILVAPRIGTINDRVMHTRAWRRAFDDVLDRFHEKLILLASESPLSS